MKTEGKLPRITLERMLALEGVITTCPTIKRTITRWQKTGNTTDSPSSGPPRNIPKDHNRCINDEMANKNELIAADLKGILTEKFGPHHAQYGLRTIAQICNKLGGHIATTAMYCQAIRGSKKNG